MPLIFCAFQLFCVFILRFGVDIPVFWEYIKSRLHLRGNYNALNFF